LALRVQYRLHVSKWAAAVNGLAFEIWRGLSHQVSGRNGAPEDPLPVVLTLAVLTIVCAAVLAVAGGRRNRKRLGLTRFARVEALLILVTAALWLAFVGVFVASLVRTGAEPAGSRLQDALSRAASALAYVCAGLTAVVLVLLVRSWRHSAWTPGSRLLYTLVVAVMILTTCLLVRWKVLTLPWR
jgi:magnesium-transporting ATPase (P-type)